MSFRKKVGQYTIEKVLGVGGYGQVYLTTHRKKQEKIAIKVSRDRETLMREYSFLKQLSKLDGFMKIYEYRQLEDDDYFAAELLGKNLSYNYNDRILSLECVCAIGIELIDRIEKMHENNIIHRDMKPSQFVLSADQKSIVLIDFGMACFYRVNGQHKEFKTRRKCRGTVSYASINNHLGFRQSRRDDLESLCYSLIYLVRGGLPWKLETYVEGFKKWKVVLNQKINITDKELFGDLPIEFSAMLKYTRKLCYDQTPNYSYMKSLMEKFLNSDKIWHYFDWLESPDKPRQRRCSQIVDGATTITKLKREKKVYERRPKKVKFSVKDMHHNKEMNNPDFNNIISEKFKSISKTTIQKHRHKHNLSMIDERDRKTSIDSHSDSKNSHLHMPNYANNEMEGFKIKKYKSKKSMRLYKVLSALDIDKIEKPNELKKMGSCSNSIGQTSGLLQEGSDECSTPKLELPEFKNRDLIIKARAIFADNSALENHRCLVF
ncbi:hypothetical protein SteCoe_16473 [Stentor coeruleus]|uniref:Casein kinase I n=1 Tax=Stentor coeruleus TaxID=5963 RepID=A0A1R2C1E7_9CILI|nr:hypothetical protein SteCoe_16473 [Stentor coeruleus]